MNALRKALGLLLFLAFSRTASAVIVPTLPDPGWENGTTAAYTAINYDYGPRVVSSGSNPHVGIDYDIRTGAKAYAVSGQSITAVSAAGDNSLIQTGMWRYIHMVIDGPYVQTATYPAGNTVLIFREGNGSGGYNLLKVLGRAGVNYLDDYHDPVSNQDAPVQTAVSQGEWLFVSNSLNHLHLDINNGEENPLKYVKHRDEANPVLWPKYRFFDTSAITDFSDNVLFNHGANPVLLQLGSDVRTDKDLNSVEMLIKPAGGAYASLDKWTYEPYGGYQGYVNTVSGERNTIWLSGDLESIRNSSFEGVYPLEGMNNESFDFFKLQWNTRQKASGTGLALLNSEAKWPDGDYSVKMIAKDATEHEAFTEEQKQVDNFRPFLKMVGIEGSEAKYYKEWTFSGTTLSCDGPLVNKPLGDGDYTITLEFSEPVVNPTASIDTYGALQLIPAGNQKNFSANLSVGGASGIQDGLRTLTVTATDLSGNQILTLNPAKKIINPNSELTRDPASGVMQGTGGEDRSVDFSIATMPPYVKRVKLVQNSAVVYEAGWVEASGARALSVSASNKVIPKTELRVEVEFSKPMQFASMAFSSLTGPADIRGGAFDPAKKIFKGYVAAQDVENISEGFQAFRISGRDPQSRELDSNPATIAYKDSQGNLHNYEDFSGDGESQIGGVDPSHLVNIKGVPPVVGISAATRICDGVSGIQAEPVYGVAGGPVSFDVKDSTTGIKEIHLSGESLQNPLNEQLPVPVSTRTWNVGALPVGEYLLSVKDALNNETRIRFRLERLDVSLDESALSGTPLRTAEGYARISAASFGVKINSTSGLESVSLLGPSGTPELPLETELDSVKLSGEKTFSKSYSAGFSVGGVYRVVVRDLSGNIKTLYVTIGPGSGGVSSSCLDQTVCGNDLDIWRAIFNGTPQSNSGVMPGAAMLNGKSELDWRYTSVESGTFVAASEHQLGYVDISVTSAGGGGTFPRASYYETAYENACPDNAIFAYYGCVEGVFGCRGPSYSRCGVGQGTVNIPVGRYARIGHNAVKTDQGGMPMGMCPSPCYDSSSNSCGCGLSLAVTGSVFSGEVYGVTYSTGITEGIAIPAGSNISVIPANGLELIFAVVSPPGGGAVWAYNVFEAPPDGYVRLRGYEIGNTVPFSGNVTLSYDYDPATITPQQALLAKVVRVVVENNIKIYQFLPTMVDTVAHKIKGITDRFSSYMVVYPVHPTAILSSPVSATEDFSILSERTETVEKLPEDSPELAAVETALLSNGLMPVGGIYSVSGPGTPYQPYAIVSAAYSDPELSSLGIAEETLSLYGFDASGNAERLENLTIESASNRISGRTYSPYAFYAVMISTTPSAPPQVDEAAPVTLVNYLSPVFQEQYSVYSSSYVFAVLGAYDLPLDTPVASGVYATYYKIDPTDTLLATGLVSDSTGYFEVYTSTLGLALSEGRHKLLYGSVDLDGNYEVANIRELAVDLTPPAAKLVVAGSSSTVSGVLYVGRNSTIGFSGEDVISNGVLSGIRHIRYLVDISTSDCSGTPTFIGPPGTCNNPVYISTFTLPVGAHSISFFAVDNVGNVEEARTAQISVLENLETVAPITRLVFAGYEHEEYGEYLSTDVRISVSAEDPVVDGVSSGISAIYYLVDMDPAISTPTVFTEEFSVNEGTHTIWYTSVDNSGNFDIIRSSSVFVDGTAPQVELGIQGEHSELNGVLYAAYGSSVVITAGDILSNGVMSGGVEIHYLVDLSTASCEGIDDNDPDAPVGTCANTGYAGPFELAPGTHTVYYTAEDRVGNEAAMSSVTVVVAAAADLVDIFSPTGSLSVGRYEHTATRLPDGKVLVAGGWSPGMSALAEVYDPATGVFTSVGDMSVVRVGHRATLLGNGKVLLTGGSDGPNYLSSAELFDPQTGLFTPTGAMSAGRYTHTATLLPDGKVLIAGGRGIGNAEVSSAEVYDPQTGVFTRVGDMNNIRCAHFAVTLKDGRVLLGGGWAGNGPISSVEIYSPSAGTFSAANSLGEARYHPGTALLADGRVLVAGGAAYGALASAEIYDPASGNFTGTGGMRSARLHVNATVLSGGKVLFTGGSESDAAAELYDPASGQFSVGASMSVARDWATATQLLDGRVLVASGYNGAYLTSAELYGGGVAVESLSIGTVVPSSGTAGSNFSLTGGGFGVYSSTCAKVLFGETPADIVGWTNTSINGIVPATLAPVEYQVKVERVDNSITRVSNSVGFTVLAEGNQADLFVPTGSLSVGRYEHTATRLPDGKVLVAGGWSPGMSALAEVYDPATGVFTSVGDMSVVRAGHRATLLGNGKVLLTGGVDGPNYLSSAELFDPQTGLFTPTGAMSAGRYTHTATLLPDGKVLVAGGRGIGNAEVSSAEVYDPQTGVFTRVGDMNNIRCAHFAVTLKDGRVLLGGGWAGSGPISSVEIYSPSAGTFSAANSLGEARYHPGTALLADGRVLVAGGAAYGALASAEIYDPASGNFTGTGGMRSPRLHVNATVLSGGKVLFTGGSESDAAAELYDPASGQFSVGASMSVARDWATATQLLDGRVLVASGYNGAYLTSAELFVPSGWTPGTPPGPTAEIVPSSGPIGMPFTIDGAGFGTYSAALNKVLIGGATAPLTLWTDTQIKGTVPGALTAGQHAVAVTRGTTTLANAGTFQVLASQAETVLPSSGAIGVPFTITGSGFGNYVANYTRVLIGDTTCQLTLWTDTQIKGTVPGALAAGDYELVVERVLNGGVTATQPLAFKVLAPELYAIIPTSGSIGVGFTLTGANFGNYVANYTRVLIGGATAPLTLWADSQIKGTVPGSLVSGTYDVLVERELNGGLARSEAVQFTLVAPVAASVAPSSGAIGVPFTINGSSFGNYVAGYTKVLIGGTTCPLTLWSDTQIKGTVPGALAAGDYELLVTRELNGGTITTQPAAFRVLAPELAALVPSSGAIGVPFTISGANFGNYVANYTRVLIGGATAPLTLWTDTQIKGTVPGALAAGEQEVYVERALNGGLVRTSSAAFTVLGITASAITPSSGPIGVPFTITGSGFGNYVANYTRVLIGGATAPLTLWTDTQIKGTIPGALSDGEHEVYVERSLNGGVTRSGALAFLAAGPQLAQVTPATAAVLAPFTLTGYNFGNYVANYTRVLIGGATTQLTLWTDLKIQGKLPALGAGEYPVLVQRQLNGGLSESATAYISVVEPDISSMTPVSGAVGTVFNLYGTGFGPYDASLARVFVGGAQCALSLWTDTQIRGTVPGGVGYGTHTVVAMRGSYDSDPLEFVVPVYTPSMFRIGNAQEFRLGEVYVYPDPAKGGKVPTFHIEVGTADTVKIKVYTVAGQLAHEATLTGNPQAAGGGYAYEYQWTGRIASGVYYYTVEAERSGKKLKTRGKFAVIR